MSGAARVEILKEDALGRVERIPGADGGRIRRVACGGRLPDRSSTNSLMDCLETPKRLASIDTVSP